jgi:hypothetical protein
MRFHANSVSASEEGDYYQIWIEAKDSAKEVADPHEVDGPYVIVQRDFEMPDDGRCYVETHDSNYIGHFRRNSILSCQIGDSGCAGVKFMNRFTPIR